MTWLTTEEAITYTKFSDRTLFRLRKNGVLIEGIHYSKGKPILYDSEMLDAYIRHRNDPEGHQQAIEAKRCSLLANQLKRMFVNGC